MPYVLAVIMALTIFLPVAEGLKRYKRLQPDDRLFVCILCLGALNELVSLTSIHFTGSNAASFNCYILAESILLVIMFYHWGIKESRTKAIIAGCTLVIVWITDNFYNGNIHNFYGVFGLYCSLLMMYYSIRQISRCIAFDNDNIFYNGRCIASMGLLLYFSVKTITDTFFIIDLGMSLVLQAQILGIASVVNAIVNITYYYAILCLKPKVKFTLEYL